jgi:WXXGXW repeat (2 copies)
MKRFLRALALSGILATAAAAAQAQIFVGVRAPFRPAVVVATPPCPGVGYIWAPGYYAGAVWVPGRWAYRGYGRVYAPVYRHDYRAYPQRWRR